MSQSIISLEGKSKDTSIFRQDGESVTNKSEWACGVDRVLAGKGSSSIFAGRCH